MSKRVTLTDQDIELIKTSLWCMHKQVSIVNSTLNPASYLIAYEQRIRELEAKLAPKNLNNRS